MKIALDAMGGDFAPRELVRGAWEAFQETGQEIILVGNKEILEQELNLLQPCPGLEIHHAPEIITMTEAPAAAVRGKKTASVVVAADLVRAQEASALVSAGNTGATMAAALLRWGRIPGIVRPAIAGILPSAKGATVLLDVGANVDCKPKHLQQFAMMGSLYARKVLGIPDPKIGLLSVGEESTKGNELTQATFPLFKDSGLNFYGNVEGSDVFQGTVDVVVCDGFVGNVVLKSAEGLATVLFNMIKDEMQQSMLAKAGAFLALPAIKNLKKKVDYTEYGGYPLLGVNGVAIVCHGRSNSAAVKNAIKRAHESVATGLIDSIGASLNNFTGEVGFVNEM